MEENSANFDILRGICETDLRTLKEKGKTYGDSWKKRGGVGAFMMLARKWDRLENIVSAEAWDVFSPAMRGAIMEEVRDLRAYLLLVEGACMHDEAPALQTYLATTRIEEEMPNSWQK